MFVSYTRNIFLIILFVSTIFLSTSNILQSQGYEDLVDSVKNKVNLEILPQFPKAGDTVNAKVVSYSTNLDRANITWKINGEVTLKGIGKKTHSFTVGQLGTQTNVTVTIVTDLGVTIIKSASIKPADIDIIWQATTHTPHLYKGKAMYPHQGLITFYAVVNTGSATSFNSASNYIFKWSKNGDVLGSDSGYGKNTLTHQGMIISKPLEIEVEVTDLTGKTIGQETIKVSPQSPEVALYEDSLLYGPLYNKALTNINLEEELTLLATPYFFNIFPEVVNLVYTWSLDNRTIPPKEDPKKLVLRAEGEEAGKATIALKVQNTEKVLQFDTADIKVEFNGN